MNFTLSLRHTDTLRKFRRNAERWCVDGRVLVIKRGPMPPELLAWRAAVQPLLFTGPESAAKERRRACWDRLVHSDPSHRGAIVHYCSGFSCCPDGRAGLENRLRGPLGIPCLLDPPPAVWPRKSWAGRAEVASHCLLLELCGGLISRNFRVLMQAAQSRAMLASARLAACMEASSVRGSAMEGDIDPDSRAAELDRVKYVAAQACKAQAQCQSS